MMIHANHRWKQRDIHERREARKGRIAEYEATIATNAILEPRLQTISKELAEGGAIYFAQILGRLKENPSREAPPHQEEVTYDQMILNLLNKVFDEVVVKKGVPQDDLTKLGPALSKELDEHVINLSKVTVDAKKGLEEELSEQRKHITSDDIKVGWDSKVSCCHHSPFGEYRSFLFAEYLSAIVRSLAEREGTGTSHHA
jgi:cell division cycle protein 37